MAYGGAYPIERAAALSGVPRSTVYHWARRELLVPSVSASTVRLWSYTDLLGLRYIYWLRKPKALEGEREYRKGKATKEIPRSKMREVERALQKIRELDLDLFEGDGPTVRVDRGGNLYVADPNDVKVTLDGQIASDELIDLVAPFAFVRGMRGPNLVKPSDWVRIHPRRLSGAPHVESTRVETQALRALETRGFSVGHIGRLYPALDADQIRDALGIERQLEANLRKRAAA